MCGYAALIGRDVLLVCRMRDSVMVDLGIRMEDKADGSSAWMADDAETLRQERREREDKARQEALVKAKKAVDVKKALLEKVEKQANQCTVQEALRNDYSRCALKRNFPSFLSKTTTANEHPRQSPNSWLQEQLQKILLLTFMVCWKRCYPSIHLLM